MNSLGPEPRCPRAQSPSATRSSHASASTRARIRPPHSTGSRPRSRSRRLRPEWRIRIACEGVALATARAERSDSCELRCSRPDCEPFGSEPAPGQPEPVQFRLSPGAREHACASLLGGEVAFRHIAQPPGFGTEHGCPQRPLALRASALQLIEKPIQRSDLETPSACRPREPFAGWPPPVFVPPADAGAVPRAPRRSRAASARDAGHGTKTSSRCRFARNIRAPAP